MKRILVVDDSPEIPFIVRRALGPSYETLSNATLSEAMESVSGLDFDLILLDVSLPDGNGFDSFLHLRAASHRAGMPILFLSNRNEAADRIQGYRLGADDYIPKSVDPIELRTRIEAKLRPAEILPSQGTSFRKGPLRFDSLRQDVFVVSGTGERSLKLTSTEYRLLLYFAQHEDHALHREQLLAASWPSGTGVSARIADVYVCILRKKISGCGYAIKPVYGTGYRFMADAR